MNATDQASEATTLIELLERRAVGNHDLPAYTYGDEPRTYGRLWSDVERFATLLINQGVEPGGRVVLALPNGHDFFTAFYGVLRAGAVAVPIFPGVPSQRVIDVAKLCGARHMVARGDVHSDELARWRADAGDLRVVQTSDPAGGTVEFPSAQSEDVAFIQYTSGSTGDPKGVMLTHVNLLTNIRQMIEGMEITPQDRFVSWLPTYHDMGLILMTMVPFYVAAPLFVLPTSLRSTDQWMEAIARHDGTFTASPDFGYRLCLRQAADRGTTRHDVSSLRVALNAAEPVRASTIDGFHDTFGLEDVMVAAYGLVEATVGVSMWKPSTANRVDARGSVSVGRPFPGVTVHILDDDDNPLPAGEPGHIVVQSPAVTRGYFLNPRATEALLVAPDTVRTGDIGCLDDDGYLYILSRAKDVIIHAGRNVYPQEVEEVVNAVDGVRYAAAVGIDNGRVEGEQVTVFAEIRPRAMPDDDARKHCVIAIVQAVRDRFGFRPGRVHLVAPRTIPMTHNGKLRRRELKQRYLDGAVGDRVLYPLRPSS